MPAPTPKVVHGAPGRWALGPRATPRVFEPPTNLTPATARALSPLPYSEVCNVHLEGSDIPLTVWYRVTAFAGQFGIGFQGSPDLGSSYNPTVAIFKGHPESLTSHLITAGVGALQIPVTPGETYFFQVAHVGPGIAVGGVFLTISTRLHVNLTVPNTGLLIGNDAAGFPLTGLDGTGAGALQTRPFPAGETACMLPSGMSLWEDGSDLEHLYLYDATLTLLASPAWSRDSDAPAISSNGADTFYVADSRSLGAQIRTVSDAGVMGPTTWTVPEHNVYALSISPDETIAYYRTAALGDGPLQRYNLTTSTPMSDLAAAIPGARAAGELLTLGDGTTLVGYRVTGTDYVTHYAADGSTLQTIAMPGADMQINRLTLALNAASFWVWLWGTGPNSGIDTFVQIRVSDGVTLETVTSPQYASGVFTGPITSLDVPFGHPLSCPFVPPPPPGLPPYGPPTLEPPHIPPETETDQRYIRRLRRAPHVNHEHARVFFRTFELDLERGQGLARGQGSDPIVMLRLSRDGGQTWGEEMRLHAGALGAYTQRVIARRLGQARDTVFEVTVSDPIAWSLVGAWLDLEGGTS